MDDVRISGSFQDFGSSLAFFAGNALSEPGLGRLLMAFDDMRGCELGGLRSDETGFPERASSMSFIRCSLAESFTCCRGWGGGEGDQ